MAFELPPLPSFQVQQPDVLGNASKMLQLRDLVNRANYEQQLRPLQLQQQEQATQAQSMANEQQQMQLDSTRSLIKAIKDGAFNKYAGVETADGSGFDAAGAYKDLVGRGVLPAQAAEQANSILTIAKNNAEIAKNQGQAGEAQQTIRIKTLDQLATKLGSIGDMTATDATKALASFKQDLVANPKAYAGLTQMEMAHLYAADLEHLPAIESLLGLESKLADFHKSKAQATTAAQGVIDPVTGMSPDTEQQVHKEIAVTTNPQVQAAKVAVAKAEGEARAAVEAQVARGSNAALANVPPHLVAPATADATKAGTEYAQAKSVSDRLKAMMDAAKNGNVVSYQLIPQEGALQITTSQGVHRINMAEIQNYGGGSIFQRMEGHIGKTLTGKSIPDSVLKDMEEMQEVQAKGARTKYENSLKTINQTYGAGFKPVEMEDLGGGSGNDFFSKFGGKPK